MVTQKGKKKLGYNVKCRVAERASWQGGLGVTEKAAHRLYLAHARAKHIEISRLPVTTTLVIELASRE